MRVFLERRGRGPALVFTHGMGVSSESWAALADALSEEFTVVCWDLLGHGRSPVPADPALYTRDGALEDLDAVLGSVADAPGAPVLVGHSLGGYLTLAHAATRPGVARGLVVLATGPGYRDAENRERWNSRSRHIAPRFGVEPQVADLNLQHDSLVIDALPKIQTPTLVLAGTEDDAAYGRSGEYLERKLPHGRFERVSGGGHSMHEDTHAADVAGHIRDFVAALEA